MNRLVRLYLCDMRENMELAVGFVGKMDLDGFTSDRQMVYAVIRCLEIIGEAARCIPGSVKEQFPAIPWRGIVDMSTRLAHRYFDINLKTVWSVLKEDIPVLLPLLIDAIENTPE